MIDPKTPDTPESLEKELSRAKDREILTIAYRAIQLAKRWRRRAEADEKGAAA
jgi:hypothetical protein